MKVKKLSTIVLSGLMAVSLNASTVYDESVVDRAGLAGLIFQKDKLSMNQKKAGEWYLYNVRKELYSKVHDDEFEYEDVHKKSYKILIDEIDKESKKVMNNEIFTHSVKISYGKYNFNKEMFPLNTDIKSNQKYKLQLPAYGTGKIVELRSPLQRRVPGVLAFNNINIEDNTQLSMDKLTAKTFMKEQKKRGGNYRELTARYTFIVEDIYSKPDNVIKCSPSYRCYPINKVQIYLHVLKLEILDNGKNVIKVYDYKKGK
jgi:hypothetical protein